MTQMAPRKFYDDVENHYEIKKTLYKERHRKAFRFLYKLFFKDKEKWTNSIRLSYSLCIPNSSTSYQILSSLAVLNLLNKVERSPKRIIFTLKNETWWHIFKKEVDKNGGN